MLAFFLLGLSLGAVLTAPAEAEVKLERGNCPMFWYSFNGRCYKYISTHMTWASAELHCLTHEANLVSVHSLQEFHFVQDLIKNFDPSEGYTWIGLSDIHEEGRWMWSDGSRVDFTMWAPTEPNNLYGEHCVHTNDYGTKWNDRSCHYAASFVCASRTTCP